MSKKTGVLGWHPDERRQTLYHVEDGKTYIETRVDAEPIIEAAKILAEVPPDPDTGWRFIGSLPQNIFNQAVAEGWIHDKARIRAWLSDRDNRQYNGGRENPF